MSLALTTALGVLSAGSVLYTVRRYQSATPEQRPQILSAACGAVVVAAVMWFLVGRR